MSVPLIKLIIIPLKIVQQFLYVQSLCNVADGLSGINIVEIEVIAVRELHIVKFRNRLIHSVQ